MRTKIALAVAAAASAVALLVPATSHAAQPACVVVNGPAHFHLQLGYAPTGPDGCTHIPG